MVIKLLFDQRAMGDMYCNAYQNIMVRCIHCNCFYLKYIFCDLYYFCFFYTFLFCYILMFLYSYYNMAVLCFSYFIDSTVLLLFLIYLFILQFQTMFLMFDMLRSIMIKLSGNILNQKLIIITDIQLNRKLRFAYLWGIQYQIN